MPDFVRQLPWGISPPEPKPLAWGARAIFADGRTDIVWDRQELVGGTDEERRRFVEWWSDWGYALLAKLIREERLTSAQDRTIEASAHGWHLVANPRRSHGYLYVGVYPDGDEVPGQHPAPPKGRVGDANARRVSCHCCGASFYTSKPHDPERDTGYGTCEGCHEYVAAAWVKHGFPGERPITIDEARARLAKYA